MTQSKLVFEWDASKEHKNFAKQEMLSEYDLRGKKGVRGKYYRAYRQGHTVKVYQDDGTASIQHFTLEDGAVLFEPDVRQYFPDSEAVNHALRTLIALVPAKYGKRKATQHVGQ